MYLTLNLRAISLQQQKKSNESNLAPRKKTLKELSSFVVNTNLERHGKNECVPQANLVETLFEEDTDCYENSNFFLLKNDDDEIVASVKVTKWDNKAILPIKRIYDIDVCKTLNLTDSTSVWHVGRLAIRQTMCTKITLFKKLLIQAIYPVYMDRQSVLVAECDSKLFKTLSILGIKVKSLGPGVMYLSSETIPMYVMRDGLRDFFENNLHLYEAPMSNDSSTKMFVLRSK